MAENARPTCSLVWTELLGKNSTLQSVIPREPFPSDTSSYNMSCGELVSENGSEQVLSLILFYILQTHRMAQCSSGPIYTQSGFPSAGAMGSLPFSLLCDTPGTLRKTMGTWCFSPVPFPHSNLTVGPSGTLGGIILWIVAKETDKHQEPIRPWRNQNTLFLFL